MAGTWDAYYRRVALIGATVCLLGCSADGDENAGNRGQRGASTPAVGGAGGDGAQAAGDDGFGNSNAGSVGSAGGGAPVVTGMDPITTCAEGMAYAAPVTPTVWLVIDSSGSMNDDFNGPSRWEALRSALMDPDGVVTRLQSAVRFGMVIYNGPDNGRAQCDAPENINPNIFANPQCTCLFGFEDICCDPVCGGEPPPPPTTGCANLVTVDPALDNFATLDAAYPAMEIGGWTPTDRALEHVVDNLPVYTQDVLDGDAGPVYVVLATDGAPNDRCDDAGGGGRRGGQGLDPEVAARVVAATDRGVQQGMKMFVISLAGGDPQLQTHLEDVARTGNTGQQPFVPSTKDDLVSTLQQIIGGATCQVGLSGSVQAGQQCAGEVQLNGATLPCDEPNGWTLADERTVQLTGSACDNFLGSESMVRAAFPCGVFTPD